MSSGAAHIPFDAAPRSSIAAAPHNGDAERHSSCARSETHTLKRRIVLHVDLDCFYAQVEQLDEPRFRNRPLIVGGGLRADGSIGRGVVLTSSYEARAFGVRTAMPTRRAIALCPMAIVARPRFDRYRELSHRLFDVCREFTPVVEVTSIDEAYLDGTGLERWLRARPSSNVARSGDYRAPYNHDAWPLALALELQRTVFERTGLTVSIGVGPTRLLAKIASRWNKPNGAFYINERSAAETIAPLPVRSLPGVGPAAAARLLRFGYSTIGDLQRAGVKRLVEVVGSGAESLWRRAHGLGASLVVPGRGRKTISRETTFHDDVRDRDRLLATLSHLSDSATWRLRREGLCASCVSIKLRDPGFVTHTHDESLSIARGGVGATDHAHDIFATASKLLIQHYRNGAAVRLVGVSLSGLTSNGARQLDLCDGGAFERSARLDRAADIVRARFGFNGVIRARSATIRRQRRSGPGAAETGGRAQTQATPASRFIPPREAQSADSTPFRPVQSLTVPR